MWICNVKGCRRDRGVHGLQEKRELLLERVDGFGVFDLWNEE